MGKDTTTESEQSLNENSSRRRMFAKYCWNNRHKHAPSGKTWREVFNQKEGVDLDMYVMQIRSEGPDTK